MEIQSEIFSLLYRLGATPNYNGFFYTSCALQLCIEQPERLLLITKHIYPDVAKQYNTSQKSVERDIRTIGKVIWQRNKPLLEQLACRKLLKRPSTATLLSILLSNISSSSYNPLAVHRLGKAKTVSGEYNDMRMMYEPVNQSSRKPVIAEYSVPLTELKIRRNY